MRDSLRRLRTFALAGVLAGASTLIGPAPTASAEPDSCGASCKIVNWEANAVPAVGEGIVCLGVIRSAGWTFEGSADLPDGTPSAPHVGYAKVWFQGPWIPFRPCRIAVRVIWRNLDNGTSGEEVRYVDSTLDGASNAEVYFYPGAGRTEIGITTFGPNLSTIVSTYVP